MRNKYFTLMALFAALAFFASPVLPATAQDEAVVEAPVIESVEAPDIEVPDIEVPDTVVEESTEELDTMLEEFETESDPVVTEATASDAESELIELETERQLAEGIEVVPGDEGKDLITITLDDVPLQDVVRMFTRISGANIVAGTNLAGNVTVSLQDVEWDPALRVILDSVDMVLVEKTPGIHSIMSKSDLAAEPVTVDTIFLNYTTVSNVLPVIQRMLISTNASVAAFPSANALVLQETADRMSTIKGVVAKIDIPRPQVYIEAKFVELNDEAISDMGIDWSPLGSDESGLGYTLGATGMRREFSETRRKNKQDANGNIRTRSNVDATDREYFPNSRQQRLRNDTETEFEADVTGRNFTTIDGEQGTIETIIPYEQQTVISSILTAEDFELTLSMLKQNTGVDIISNPKVIVSNGETAMIHVGRNEPNVVAVPQGDTGDRFAYALDSRNPYIEIGVKLEVTPTVNTEENISLELMPELSRLIGQKEVGEGATKITFPITQIRRVETEFSLESGSTVAIGGLTESRDSESIKKIPILGDIPLLGKYLFRHTHTEKLQDEVIIFCTVGLATPETLVEVSGIPSEGRLIHGHLASKAQLEEE